MTCLLDFETAVDAHFDDPDLSNIENLRTRLQSLTDQSTDQSTDQTVSRIDSSGDSLEEGVSSLDCEGVADGSAVVDNCGTCVGGSTGVTACTQDCNNEWGGSAVIDSCGVCGGTGESLFYIDSDSDSLGEPTSFQSACNAPSNHVSNLNDTFVSSTIYDSTEALEWRPALGTQRYIIPFDIDGDSDLDFFHSYNQRNSDFWFINQSNNNFNSQPMAENIPYVADNFGLYLFSAQGLDIDGDSDMDFVISEFLSRASILINDSGSFSRIELPTVLGSDVSIKVLSADFNNDDQYDFLDSNTSNLSLLKNTSTDFSSFDTISLLDIGSNFSLLIDIGDFTGDNFTDIVVIKDSNLLILKNNCSGDCSDITFTETIIDTSLSIEVSESRETYERIQVVDYDGDGDLDIFLIVDTEVLLYRNTSSGDSISFDKSVLWSGPENLISFVVADVDSDSDYDIVTSLHDAGKVLLLENSGGTYTDQIIQENLDDPTTVQVIDTDGDGDLDILSVDETNYLNLHINVISEI